MNPRKFFVGRAIGLLAVIIVVGIGYFLTQKPTQQSIATTFEECVAAGNAVMESYPRQCRSVEGTLFVEEIDTPVAESWGTILGTVLLGPTCPVMREPPDPECADKPYQTNLALTTVDGARVIKTFSSKSDGTFRVEVQAGEYAIRSAATANVLPYCSSNGTIQVRINETTNADVSCDTGIR
jgi:hypothetical protein